MKTRTFLRLLLLIPLALTSASAREWTATDGRKLQADFVSATAEAVTVKRAADGRNLTIPLSSLSETDQAWIKEQANKPSEPSKPVEGEYAELLKGDWALSEEDGLPFALFGAKDLDASKKYPLVVSLHGRSQNNENGKQLGPFAKAFAEPENYEKRPCIIFSPLGYQPWGGEGTAWNNEPGTKALEMIEKLINELPIDEKRVYVCGHSMGGFGSCHFAITEPKLFAAVVASAGCSSPSSAGTFKRLPLWLHHAEDDKVVEVDYSRNLAEAVGRSKSFNYSEYPTGGHGIARQVFYDPAVHEWMFQQGVE